MTSNTDTAQVASALWTLFAGRRDCYGKGKGLCVKQPVTEELIGQHLAGEIAIGIYPLTPDGLCAWVCTDLDLPGEPDLARLAKALVLAESYHRLGCCPFIERSKSKGFHAWVFFRDPVEAAWARRLAYHALADAGLPPDTEVFPKQDHLTPETPFGSYVNLPYFGQNNDGRRMMLDPATSRPWTVNEFLDALSLTDPNEVLLAPDADDADVLVAGGSGDAAPLLGEDAPYRTRHEKGKRVIGLLVARLWPDGQQAVLDAALNWNAARCQPPLPEAEVRQMVADFWRKEEAKQAKEGVEETAKLKVLPYRTAADIIAAPLPMPDILLDGLSYRGELAILTGPYDALKSRLAMEIVRAIASGESLLGRFDVPNPATVILIQEEINPGVFDRERVIPLLDGLPEEIAKRIYVVSRVGFRLNLEWIGPLEEMITKTGAVAVLIDPLGEVTPTWPGFNLNYDTSVTEMLRPLKALRDKYQVTIFFVHHDPKLSEFERRARGSSVLLNSPDLRILLQGIESADGLHRSRIQIRSRNMRRPEPFNIVCLDDGRVAWEEAVAISSPERESAVRAVKYLTKDGQGPTTKQIADCLNITLNATRLRLLRAEDDGFLNKVKEGNDNRWTLA